MSPSVPRKIIHIDCDCFYAAVEMRENPRLKNIPLAVGGQPNERGVIATCNYPARKYGIHSAMASARALKLCPNLIILKPNFALYKETSEKVMHILSRFSPLIEPLSLDEAFLDVSGSPLFSGSATLMAKEIRRAISEEVTITASAGISFNKFLAKVASDINKPDGMYVITPQQADEFLKTLNVKKIFGVGKVTEQKLNAMGVYTCSDLQKIPLAELEYRFGVYGARLHWFARGEDSREVAPSTTRKTLSVEKTYAKDLSSHEEIEEVFAPLFQKFHERWTHAGKPPFNKILGKIKFSDFSTITFSEPCAIVNPENFSRILCEEFKKNKKPARLLGMGVSLEDEPLDDQPSLFS